MCESFYRKSAALLNGKTAVMPHARDCAHGI